MEQEYSTYEIRLRAVHAVEDGFSVTEVAKAYQTHRATIYRWWQKYEGGGQDGLLRKHGSGRPRVLDQLTAEELTELVLSSALDFGYESDLWTCGRVRETIRSEFDVDVSRWTVWRRLREANLTYQKPDKRYMNASEDARKHWCRYELPKIRRTVKKYRAILYFEDEANISLTAFLGKTWAPCGKTPTQEVTGNRGGVAAMSAIRQRK